MFERDLCCVDVKDCEGGAGDDGESPIPSVVVLRSSKLGRSAS